MTKRTFPQLPPEMASRLQAIHELSKSDPGYFEDTWCPYPEEVKALLRGQVVSGPAIKLFESEADDGERADVVLSEVESTIEEMKSVELKLSESETSEKIAFYRAKTQLLERWVSLKEKLHSIKQVSEFQRVVVRTLEQFLDKDQVQDFKNKLKEVR